MLKTLHSLARNRGFVFEIIRKTVFLSLTYRNVSLYLLTAFDHSKGRS